MEAAVVTVITGRWPAWRTAWQPTRHERHFFFSSNDDDWHGRRARSGPRSRTEHAQDLPVD